ncbi:MAG: Holliday junction resolvase RuvX [Actinomycetota bacterium]
MIGLDLGSRRIGVAVCDAGRTVATPFRTVKRVGDRPVEHAELADIVGETGAVLAVVGLPLGLDGGEGPAVRTVRSELRALGRRLGIPVTTHDERLTTVSADDALRAQGVRGRRRTEVVDQVAAAVILQDWLDRTAGS